MFVIVFKFPESHQSFNQIDTEKVISICISCEISFCSTHPIDLKKETKKKHEIRKYTNIKDSNS